MSAVELPSLPRVVIADDHPPTRRGLRRALTTAGYEIVDEAATGEESIDAARAHHPDLCVLDVRMPGGGIAAAEQILAEMPETSVVMLTAMPLRETVVQAMRAGAVGVLSKELGARQLTGHLQRVLDGHISLPEEVIAVVASPSATSPRPRWWQRQPEPAEARDDEVEQVLILLSNGVTIAAVADVLGMPLRRVRQIVIQRLQPATGGH